MTRIDRFDFNTYTPGEVSKLRHNKKDVGMNWPVVYIINNDEEAYIGETIHASNRVEQHLQNEERQRLTEIRLISDDNFNKSVILDLEAFLIKHMQADNKYMIQNGNNGLRDHDYYQRSEYSHEFETIWERLRRLGVVNNSIDEIENSELYKYSPYKTLGAEQMRVEKQIIDALAKYFETGKRVNIIVRGGAGTGKTILAVYLMKLISDVVTKGSVYEGTDDEEYGEDPELISAAENIKGIRKIGLVIPQKSLKTSLKDVFSSIRALDKKMVMGTSEVVDDFIKTGKKFDLLIVDEAHRLKCRNKGHLSYYPGFDKCNRLLGLDKEMGNELDWMMECSNNLILFRDELQTVRPCDIDADAFMTTLDKKHPSILVKSELSTQWRCEGGSDYIEYLKNIFAGRQEKRINIENYDVRLYDDCARMVEDIKEKNKEMGLCRVVAGYAWKWVRKRPNDYTIEIQNHKYRWNRTYDNWIQTPTAIDEIGCIHTVQGYDLNYTGVIIGEDIKYDKQKKEIYAVKENYFDQQGKSGVADDPEALKEYLLNIYLTLLTRGIKGTYIYVCDEALRNYLKSFF